MSLLSEAVRVELARLGGRIPDAFQPGELSVSTPAGAHPVPPPVQALLAVDWPDGQGLCTDDDLRTEVHLPSAFEVEWRVVVEDTPRAWYPIGHDEAQWFLIVDLAEADHDDFRVYRVDHDGSDEVDTGRPLSSVLRRLRPSTDRITVPASSAPAEPVLRLPCGGPQVVVELDGRSVLVTADAYTLRGHDLHTGADVVSTRIDCVSPDSLAVVEDEGRWIAVTGDGDDGSGRLRRWNLADGRPIGPPVDAHPKAVRALAIVRLGGRPFVISGGADGAVRLWDLRTGLPIGAATDAHRLIGRFTWGVTAIVAGELDGRPIAVSSGCDGAARVWEFGGEGLVPGPTLLANPDHEAGDGITSVALGELDGVPVAVTTEVEIQVWDLRSGRLLHAWEGDAYRVGLAEIAGRPAVLTAATNGWLRMCDPATGREIAAVFVECGHFVSGLRTARVAGRPVTVVTDGSETVVVAGIATGSGALR